MKTKVVEDLSKEIATEIISRTNFDVKEISTLILVRIKDNLRAILRENANEMESEYTRLLEQQQIHGTGSRMYGDIGLKLSVLKQKLAIANRIENNTKRAESIKAMKEKNHIFREELCNVFGRDKIIEIENKLSFRVNKE